VSLVRDGIGGATEGKLLDISTGGALCAVDAAESPDEGATVQVNLVLNGVRLTLQAKVRRVEARGSKVDVGLQFPAPDPDAIRLIDGYVASLVPAGDSIGEPAGAPLQ
jgi:hypothetical protein